MEYSRELGSIPSDVTKAVVQFISQTPYLLHPTNANQLIQPLRIVLNKRDVIRGRTGQSDQKGNGRY